MCSMGRQEQYISNRSQRGFLISQPYSLALSQKTRPFVWVMDARSRQVCATLLRSSGELCLLVLDLSSDFTEAI